MSSIEVTTIYWLVVVAVMTSIVACYSAFSLAARAYDRRDGWVQPWRTGGALAMGVGIWCMHYLAMFSTPFSVPVYYHVPTVALALLVSIVTALLAFTLIGNQKKAQSKVVPPSQIRVAAAGLLLGLGMAGMHYLGVASMRWAPQFSYRSHVVTFSILLSIAASWTALWVGFALPFQKVGPEYRRVAAGLIMGLGVVLVHYVSRSAMILLPWQMPYSTDDSIRITSLSVVSAFMTIGLVLFGAMMTAVLDRRNYARMQKNNRRLRKVRMKLRKSERALRDANARLVELSLRDALTGVYNRRHFEDALDAEWRRAKRGKQPLALLLIDIDHFKKLNDTYGHRAGDECLRQVALSLKDNLHRSGDTLARYGGEEFVAILPGINAAGATRVAEKMRAAIQTLEIRMSGIETAPGITVSVGAASCEPGAGTVPETLVTTADEALYRAKAEGRNRVCSAEAGVAI